MSTSAKSTPAKSTPAKSTRVKRRRGRTKKSSAVRTLAYALLFTMFPITIGYNPATIGGRAKVVDGDSIEINGARIRIWGIDAPEYNQRCDDAEHQSYPCGQMALNHMRRLVAGALVICTEVDHDRYGREVASCSARGVDLGEAMVRSGWAINYKRYSDGRYDDQEEAARADKIGIWQGTFEAPEIVRRREQR
jgi:endonuclease YncB( thermonuclease family)